MKRLMEWFEKKVVLRISHWFYLVLAALVGLGFVGSTLLMVYGLMPPRKGPAPKPIQKPPEVSVKHEKIKAELERMKAEKERKELAQAERKKVVKESAPVEGEGSGQPSEQEIIKAKIEELHKFFPERGFPWDNLVSSYCAETHWWYGDCIRWKSRVDKYGAKYFLSQIAEMAENLEKALAVLDDVARLLESIDSESAYSALRLYYDEYQAQVEARNQFIVAENERFQSESAQRERDYVQAKQRKATFRKMALIGMGGAFASFAILGLFMAVLAIERNTRTLEELIKELKEIPLKT